MQLDNEKSQTETMKITDIKEREQLLNKLAGISDKIYSPDIL
jgi:hypothetical protein